MSSDFQHLTNLLAEWQALQPIKREDEARLWRKLRLDWNYHSNRIEGNTLTYGETEILLIHGQATGDHGLRDYVEMKAHDVAIDHMRDLVGEDRPLTEADIRNLNQILLKEPFWKDAITPDGQPSRIEIVPGRYKEQLNNVRTASGDIFRFADPADVPIQMNELMVWLRCALEKKELHPIQIASKLHHDFVLIHPFGDGNGRTARLLVNYVLMRNGYLPLVVPTEQKDRYLAALRKADSGDIKALTDYLSACAAISMERGILAAKGESIEEADDLLKEIELFKRRQNGEAKEVVRKSDELMLELYRTSLRPLFAEFVETIGRLSDLFAEVSIRTNTSSQSAPWQDALDQWAAESDLSQSHNVEVIYELKGFKGEAAHPFNIQTQAAVNFAEFHYTIVIGGISGGNKLYGQPLGPNERAALVRPSLEKVFSQIKKLSGSN